MCCRNLAEFGTRLWTDCANFTALRWTQSSMSHSGGPWRYTACTTENNFQSGVVVWCATWSSCARPGGCEFRTWKATEGPWLED
ncbi:hypothetical protein SVIOM74S_02241 [Streptomyces violarus]